MDEHDGITLTMILIGICVVLVIAVIINVIIYIKRKKNPLSVSPAVNGIAKAFAILSAVAAIAFTALVGVAWTHGLYTMDIDIRKTITGIQKSHVNQSDELTKAINWTENTPPQSPNDTFVLVYRFSCKDCEAIKEEIAAKLNTTGKKWYAVSSRSPLGRAYCDFYNISSVPSLIATNSEGKTNVATIFTDDTGKVTVNEGAWEFLLRHMGLSAQ